MFNDDVVYILSNFNLASAQHPNKQQICVMNRHLFDMCNSAFESSSVYFFLYLNSFFFWYFDFYLHSFMGAQCRIHTSSQTKHKPLLLIVFPHIFPHLSIQMLVNKATPASHKQTLSNKAIGTDLAIFDFFLQQSHPKATFFRVRKRR